MENSYTKKLVVSALLCAIGIVIPIISPFKIILEPASFTLGSHIAIMIAMFISPAVAVTVSLGTAAGFFFGGFPLVIVLRAATHVVFALVGAYVLQKKLYILKSPLNMGVFSAGISIIHAIGEVAIVTAFYFGNNMSQAYYAQGFATSVMLLVGAGTFVHSMIDFSIALALWKTLCKTRSF